MDEASAATGDILIVDDTVENLRLLSSVLSERGYEVRPVPGGRQALAAARSAAPDLVLLDIDMPDMNGYDVCAALKATESLRDIPVIFLTALGNAPEKVKAFDVGGADYITKPFQVDEVLARIKVHLGLRKAQTRLREQLERLSALEQLREDLVQMVVHDMRTPLMALMHNLGFLREEGLSEVNARAAEDLRAASAAVVRLNRMANELLDVSRLEEGKLPLTLRSTGLAALAEAACRTLADLDRARPLEVCAPVEVETACDGPLVQRVLENLIGNAIKHSPPASPVRVEIHACPGRARVAVEDEGAGVPEEARALIFEKFGAVAASREAGYHSAGLGLAFCKLVVTAHGGKIGVDARAPRGSRFWFELPT